MGHWDKKYRSKRIQCVEEEDADIPAFLGNIHVGSPDREFTVSIAIQELNFKSDFVIDTGADRSCISHNCVLNYYCNKIVKSSKGILGPDGRKLSVMGFIEVTLGYKRCETKAKVYVDRGLKQNLLGKPEIKNFELISKINMTKLESKLESKVPLDINTEYPELFKGIGRFKKEPRIHLKEGAVSFCQSVPRTIVISLKPKLRIELDKLFRAGIIVPVDIPTDWCSPIVVVPKRTEDIRLCCDYSILNNNVKRSNFPILKIDTALVALKNSKIFTKLDAKAGFHQIVLHKNSQLLTTFITPLGRFMYTRLPFGINCAPEYFSQQFSEILQGIPNVIIRIDDVLIHAKTGKEHDAILKKSPG